MLRSAGSVFARSVSGPVLRESLRRKLAAGQSKRNKKAGQALRLARLPLGKLCYRLGGSFAEG